MTQHCIAVSCEAGANLFSQQYPTTLKMLMIMPALDQRNLQKVACGDIRSFDEEKRQLGRPLSG